MWAVVLVLIFGPVGSDEPTVREIPMESIEQCVQNVQHLMDTAPYDGSTMYAAACRLTPIGKPV